MGGVVVEKPKKTKKRDPKQLVPNCLCIAPQPLRTEKYLLSLAGQIPCLHYSWINHCYADASIQPPKAYLLPLGLLPTKGGKQKVQQCPKEMLLGAYPLECQSLVFYRSTKQKPLRIEVVGDPDFKLLWGKVLTEGGAKIVDRLFFDQSVDYIVSDDRPNSLIIEKSNEVGMLLCSKDWVYSSLVARTVLSPSYHPSFIVKTSSD